MAAGVRKLKYTPNPSALLAHNSKAKVKFVSGPVGSGKTSVACWDFYFLCYLSTVPIRGVVIRESYRELQDSTRQTFFEWFGDSELGLGIATYNEGDEIAMLTFAGFDGKVRTHELCFRACRKESEASKFLSTEYAFLWLEEVCPAYSAKGVMGQGLPKGVFEVGNMRIRQKGAPYLEIMVTFNPPTTRHWVYKEVYQAMPADLERKRYALFKQPPGENKENLPDNYYEDLLEVLSPDMARRFVMGETVTIYEGERVFPEAKDGVHIVDHVEPVPGYPLILGQDYGLTPACLITQILPGGQWRWLRELQLWNAGMRRFVEFLVPLLKTEFKGYEVRTIWQDPAGNIRSQSDESTCAEILTSAGFTVQDGSQNWTLRKEIIKQRLESMPMGEPGVLVSRYGCPIAAEGLLGAYRYPRTADGIIGTSPIKNESSHIMDCAQYIGTGEFAVMTGMATMEDRQHKQKIIPIFNPLSSNPRRHQSAYNWMAK